MGCEYLFVEKIISALQQQVHNVSFCFSFDLGIFIKKIYRNLQSLNRILTVWLSI